MRLDGLVLFARARSSPVRQSPIESTALQRMLLAEQGRVEMDRRWGFGRAAAWMGLPTHFTQKRRRAAKIGRGAFRVLRNTLSARPD